MKIAIAQLNVLAAQPSVNFQKMKTMIAEAKAGQADLIVFPEMCVSGYVLQDKYLDHYFNETLVRYNTELLALSDGIGIIYGNIVYQPLEGVTQGRDGRPLRSNGAYFCVNQQWVEKANAKTPGLHIKHLNPDYRIFDDSRFFLSGMEVCLKSGQPIDSLISPFLFHKNGRTYRIGLEICEDMWSDGYALDVTRKYLQAGVDFIINISCSPWTNNKEQSRDKQIKTHALHNPDFVPFVYVNNVGMQNNGKTIMTFDGDSTLYNSQGERMLSLNDDFKEELKIIELTDRQPVKHNEHKLFSALVCAVTEFDRQVFAQRVKWIIGLSGGLDSSINAALLVTALGKDRVIGYNLASRYNSETTISNARQLAQKLGIKIHEGVIGKVVDATLDTLQDYGYAHADQGLTMENIQARIRGHLLASFASCEGGVIVNNGNKIEIALGYCTLYGDAIGAFAPIGDLTKVQLFDLARQINEHYSEAIIPTNLLPEISDGQVRWVTPPSAELKDGQRDPMKWFYHDYLIAKLVEYPTAQIELIMEDYLSGALAQSPIGPWVKYYGLDDPQLFIADLEWVLRTVSQNVFKRYQMPPIVMVSRGAFGNDFRESQLQAELTDRYHELKQLILAKHS